MTDPRDMIVEKMKAYVAHQRLNKTEMEQQLRITTALSSEECKYIREQTGIVGEALAQFRDQLNRGVNAVCAIIERFIEQLITREHEKQLAQLNLNREKEEALTTEQNSLKSRLMAAECRLTEQECEIKDLMSEIAEIHREHAKELDERDYQIRVLNNALLGDNKNDSSGKSPGSNRLETEVLQQEELLLRNQAHIDALEQQVDQLQKDQFFFSGGPHAAEQLQQSDAEMTMVSQQQELIKSLEEALQHQNQHIVEQQRKITDLIDQLPVRATLNGADLLQENEALNLQIEELRSSNLELSQQSGQRHNDELAAALENSYQMLESKDETIVELTQMLEESGGSNAHYSTRE